MSNNVHDIIKTERKKRGIPPMYWSKEMARLAQSQANYCAKSGQLIHSPRYAFQGGENLAQGGGNFTPRAIVNCWLNSKKGHREYLLSPRVTKAGVGITKRNGKTFVAWAFSDQSPSYPDCPRYKSHIKPIKLPNVLKLFRRRIMPNNPFRIGVSLVAGFIGLLGIILGAHGVYVYFNRIDLLLGGEVNKLFLAIDTPIRFHNLIVWASIKGVESWFIPTLIFIGGLWLFNWSRLSTIISNILSKLQP